MGETIGKIKCDKCQRILGPDNYFKSRNLEKYPNGGCLNTCKKCLLMHINNYEKDTITPILQELDMPFIAEEWDKVMLNNSNREDLATSPVIMGKYIQRMHLTQNNKYRWADTEEFAKLSQAKMATTMAANGYKQTDIDKAVSQGSYGFLMNQDPAKEIAEKPLSSTDLGLTEEDCIYLKTKWGRAYSPEEWVSLEQLYTAMERSYDIQTAGEINTLKLACKTSLKANQLLDMCDVDGAQKMTKMYDSLMKSGKWTAAQNKENGEDVVDSVGEIVAICEKEGFIPRYYTDGPQDKIDRILEDQKEYVRELVVNELSLGPLIENAVAQIQKEQQKIQMAASLSEEQKNQIEEDKLFDFNANPLIEDQEFKEFQDFLEEEEGNDLE